MRVYVPTTLDRLQAWYDDDVLPAPVAAWAVTDPLRAEFPELSDEEAEYVVSTAAAEASSELLAEDLHKQGRRVVVVAELSYAVVAEDPESPGAVTVVSPVEGRRIAAVLADSIELPVVRQDDADDAEDLAWFATQEIPMLLASSQHSEHQR
jgi:hypothetical protein